VTPYYDDGTCVIYHGDCLEVLPTLSFDVAITDPPYNVGIKYGADVDDERTDYEGWCRSWFACLRRDSVVIAFTPGIANLGLWYKVDPPSWVVAWNKPAAMSRCRFGFNNWEPVLVWGDPPRPTADAFVAPLIPDASVAHHPCPKPVKWGRELVMRLTRAPDIVVDPFMGSGTVARAAKDCGRRFVGVEAEERYCEIAAKRLAQEVLAL
jgi:DNA modification methylase